MSTASLREIPFQIDFPIEVWEKAGAEAGKERRIGGIISTEHKDKQGEVVLQRGLDFSDFLRNGWLNDNHSRETTGVVGYPSKVENRRHNGKAATYMEGYLIPGYDKSDEIWRLAQSLQKTNRRLGFSIEGKVQERTGADGKTIAAAHVSNVAITNCPVNTVTGLEIVAKSMMALESSAKSLEAGSAISVPAVATPGDGFALRTESLERSPTDTAGRAKKKKKKRKKLSKAEGLALIQRRHPGLSERAANAILMFAKRTRSSR